MSAINIGNITNATFKVGGADCSIYLGSVKLYPQEEPTHDYSQDYFTMVVTASGNIKWSGSTTANNLSYSSDGGKNWNTANSDTTISVGVGNKVIWKGTPTPSTSPSNQGIGTFSGDTNVRYSVEGNAMSLLFGDGFKGQTSLSGKNYAFHKLFFNNKNITSAENLSLPATTLADTCYGSMFRGCTNLTTAPSELLVPILASRCYANMFQGCTSLTTAPELPATTLASRCYYQMFRGCTSLTTAPELPATTLASDCYQNMFSGCTSLTTAPELLATTLVEGCYYEMFRGCSNLTTAPQLLATTLASSCYNGMFYGCTNLNSIKCLATDISASNCTYNWVYKVAASGTFIKAPSMASWTTGNNGIPSGWAIQNAT